MARTALPYQIKTWKIEDLKRSALNAREPFSADDDKMKALAGSIKKNGIIHDPGVRTDGTIVFGARRIFAAAMAGMKEIQCKTYQKTITAAEEHRLRIEENLQREDLDPIQKAKELQSFVELQSGKAKQKTAAGLLELSETVLSRALALLKLPQVWQDLIARGIADPTHTRCVEGASKMHELLPAELATVYEQLRRSKNLNVKDWEEEVQRYLLQRTKPVCAEGSKRILPAYADRKHELDIREVNGRLVAFNEDLWRELTRAADLAAAAEKKADEPEDPKSQLPPIEVRRRIAMAWFNRRFLSHFIQYPSKSVKWLPMIEIPHPVRLEAISTARGHKDWSTDTMPAIKIIAKVSASSAATFLADFLKAAATIAIKAQGAIVKDWHQALAIADAINLDYSIEFPLNLTDEDKAAIFEVYGELPAEGKFPKGMDARSLSIPKQ